MKYLDSANTMLSSMSQYYTMQTMPGYGLLLALLGCLKPNARCQPHLEAGAQRTL
jgi:hypothetical protein